MTMDKQKICEKVTKSIYRVKAYQDDEIISVGSAFCFNDTGSLITAAHVLDNDKPFKVNEIVEKNISFTAQRKNEIPALYKANICGIKVDWPDGPVNQIIIDLAILSPKEPKQNVPHLNINMDKRFIGQEVIMAGFPDEIEFPLLLDKKLNREYLKDKQSDTEIDDNLDQLQSLLLMQKSGMIGFTDDIIIDPGLDDFKLIVGVDYIDNVMHSGASGGPVVNENGEVIGVVSKRAVTKVSSSNKAIPTHEVPSGSTLSISARTIIDFTNYMISKGNYSK